MQLSSGARRVFNHLAEFANHKGQSHIHLFHTFECGLHKGGQCLLTRECGLNMSEKRFSGFVAELREAGLITLDGDELEGSLTANLVQRKPKPKPATVRPKAQPQELRREVSPRLRFEVLKRDGFTCRYC